jgi:hypothetical protein
VYAWNSFSQTKEQTIEWLKEKLEKYRDNGRSNMNFKLNSINIDACIIEIEYTILTNLKKTILHADKGKVY